MHSSRTFLFSHSNLRMHSHLIAAAIIVILKDHDIRGRKVKTGWSHNTQRQLQQAAAAAAAGMYQPHPQMLSQAPMHRGQPNMAMQNGQMPPLPMAPQGYVYQQPMAYHAYMPPMNPYPPMNYFPNGNGVGPSTPPLPNGNVEYSNEKAVESDGSGR
jgi:hypothetical protein